MYSLKFELTCWTAKEQQELGDEERGKVCKPKSKPCNGVDLAGADVGKVFAAQAMQI